MRATVSNAGSSVIATGPGAFLLRNVTGTATVYLEREDPASEEQGFAWLATDSPLEISLGSSRTLCGRVASGGAAQTLHILRGSEPSAGLRMGVTPVVLSSGGVGVIRHGAVGATPRPVTFAQYIWLGTVLPEHMANDDMYVKEPG